MTVSICKMTTSEAENAIEQLRFGLPPIGMARSFTVGRESQIRELEQSLENTDDQRTLLIHANYGAGKSHLLRVLREIALERRFAVALIEADAAAGVRFNRMDTILGAVCRELEVPDVPDKGVGVLLDKYRNADESKLDSAAIRTRRGISNENKWDLSEILASPGIYVALRAWVHAGDDFDARNLINEWLSRPEDLRNQRKVLYEELVANLRAQFVDPRLDWQFYANNVLSFHTDDHRPSWDALDDLHAIAQCAGYRGLILLVDEFEDVIQNLRNRAYQQKAYENLIDGFFAGRFPGNSYFAVTPEFAQKCKIELQNRGVYDFDSRRFDRLPYFQLAPIGLDDLYRLAKKIRKTHAIAYAWDAKAAVGDSELHERCKSSLKAESPDRVRRAIKGIVTFLDSRLSGKGSPRESHSSGDTTTETSEEGGEVDDDTPAGAEGGDSNSAKSDLEPEIPTDECQATTGGPADDSETASKLGTRVKSAFYGAFSRLTTVQTRTVRPLLQGLDAIVCSGTGSGKTEAVMAPLVQRHLVDRPGVEHATIAYVVPTKALGNDVARRIRPPLEALEISLGLRHGDAPDAGKTKAHLAQVVVTTPESLDVVLSKGPSLLQDVKAVVIDEAHLLYNTQRGLHLAILIRRLQARSGSPIQVVGLSATIASPSFLWEFFRPNVDESSCEIVEGDGNRPIEAVVWKEQSAGDVAARLKNFIGQQEHYKILVFVNSRRVADRVAEEIRGALPCNDAVFVHHSSTSGDHREMTEREFADQARAVCVATSTLELGIDIGGVSLVVLYGLVSDWQSFLQRIGRGNRREEVAKVLCVAPHGDPHKWLTALAFLGMLRTARSGGWDPVKPLDLHGAVVQQVLSMIRENNGGFVRLADIADILSPWPHLSREIVDELADGLVEQRVCLRHEVKNRIGAGERLHELARPWTLWGNFPARSREVRLNAGGIEVGPVSASNLTRLSPGSRIGYLGRVWQVEKVHAGSIDVIEVQGQSVDTRITYFGKGVDIDPAVIDSARQMLINGSWQCEDDSLAKRDAEDLVTKWRDLGRMLAEEELPYAHVDAGYTYVTFAGRLVNDVICRSEGLSGAEVDDVCIRSPRPIDFRRVPREPELLSDHAEESLTKAGELTTFQEMLPAPLLRRDVVATWCRTPYYARVLDRLVSSEPVQIDSGALQAFLA